MVYLKVNIIKKFLNFEVSKKFSKGFATFQQYSNKVL